MKGSKNILSILEREGKKQKSIVPSSLLCTVESKGNRNTRGSLVTGGKVLVFERKWGRKQENGFVCLLLPLHMRPSATAWSNSLARKPACSWDKFRETLGTKATQLVPPCRAKSCRSCPILPLLQGIPTDPRARSTQVQSQHARLQVRAHGRWQSTSPDAGRKDTYLVDEEQVASPIHSLSTSPQIFTYSI